MSLGKQAKVLGKAQIEAVLNHVSRTRYPARNRVIFLLSASAGLRAKEIAGLTWKMLFDSRGEIGTAIHLQDAATKGRSGRVIPISNALTDALSTWRIEMVWKRSSPFVVSTERQPRTSPQAIVNLFARWYSELSFVGCSSHSGRRTFITNAARKISTVGGSIRDVQLLAGHANLRVTQGYIEADADAQRRVVEIV